MIRKILTTVIFVSVFVLLATAQNKKSDSLTVATTFKELLSICHNVDFNDPKVQDSGMFYKATPYIIYRGKDQRRNWVDFTNYKNADEIERVDGVCTHINKVLPPDNSYTITKYFTEKESEGVWHVLMVTTKIKSVDKELAFAFLKVGSRFGIGDID